MVQSNVLDWLAAMAALVVVGCQICRTGPTLPTPSTLSPTLTHRQSEGILNSEDTRRAKAGAPIHIMEDLIKSVLTGDSRQAREDAARLVSCGTPAQAIVVDGLASAMSQLDSKCSVDDFDLLAIMLAGRCVLQVIDFLYQSDAVSASWSKGVAVLGTIQGDVHDLGKNIVKAVFSGAGYQIVDLGTGVAPRRFVEAAGETQADFIMVSSLLTTSLANIKPIRDLLPGNNGALVIAGGAAVEQASAADLNVDFTAANVFDGLRFCDNKVGAS
ncbi:MAG: cobalamin-dependent protein [Armatimonadota bacterium]|nr:cobalamin-dependent protein [Armatimonadota bacterium]